jgi:hypothetical protein
MSHIARRASVLIDFTRRESAPAAFPEAMRGRLQPAARQLAAISKNRAAAAGAIGGIAFALHSSIAVTMGMPNSSQSAFHGAVGLRSAAFCQSAGARAASATMLPLALAGAGLAACGAGSRAPAGRAALTAA